MEKTEQIKKKYYQNCIQIYLQSTWSDYSMLLYL